MYRQKTSQIKNVVGVDGKEVPYDNQISGEILETNGLDELTWVTRPYWIEAYWLANVTATAVDVTPVVVQNSSAVITVNDNKGFIAASPSGRITYIDAKPRRITINYDFTASVSVGPQPYDCAIYRNGVLAAPHGHKVFRPIGAGIVVPMDVSFTTTCAVNDYFELYVSTTAPATITVEDLRARIFSF